MKTKDNAKKITAVMLATQMAVSMVPVYAQEEPIVEDEVVMDEQNQVEETLPEETLPEEETQSDVEDKEQLDETTESDVVDDVTEAEVNESELLTEETKALEEDVTLEDNSLDMVYVSVNGDDKNDGSQNNPLASLNEAARVVKSGGTINLLSNLTLNDSVRVYNKSVTIDGQGYSVIRGKVNKVQDDARSTYNPALFEINNWYNNVEHHVLTFKNIFIDDGGIAAGTVYSQQSTDRTNNGDKVQDAVIASYTSNDIVLQEGTVIQNYGGMSAVRLTAGANLYMESGSVIQDTQTIERGHKDENNKVTGQAGAVWIQGGQLNMQQGSTIQNMIGRAVYLDGGTANVGGTISNIDGRTSMWQGAGGVAIHVRNKGKAVLSGHITNIKANATGGDKVVVIRNDVASFESTAQSKIDNVVNMPVLYANHSKDVVGGIVENCSFDYLFRATYNDMIFTESALIQNNTCKGGAAKSVVYSTNGAKYTFNGQMQNNDADYAFYIINHGGTEAQLIMNDGAKLIGNGGNTGVYLNGSGSLFTMNGGEITNFSTGVDCRVKNKGPATFIMNDGLIKDNKSSAVNFKYFGSLEDPIKSKPEGLVEINGGSIENNGNDYQITTTVYPYTDNTSDYLKIKQGVLKDNTTVNISGVGKVTLDSDYSDIYLGKAKSETVEKIKEIVNTKKKNWKVLGSSALWFKPTSENLHFTINRPSSTDTSGLYAVYIPLDETGVPTQNAEIVLKEVQNTPIIDVDLDNLVPNTSYALMFVNNDIYHIGPKTTTIYTGGNDYSNTKGLPVDYDLDGLKTINSIEINEDVSTYKYNQQEEAKDSIKALFNHSYVSEDGKELKNDTVAGSYLSKIEFKDKNTKLKINGNEVEIKDGKLIIRHVSDIEKAKTGELETNIIPSEPTEPIEKAVAVVDEKSYIYINGDEDRETKRDTIKLFDDNLYGNVENDLIQKGDELLQNTTDDSGNVYDFHYLDLVDGANGNAFVTNKPKYNGKDALIYLPYPKGKDANTEFKVLHYSGFNREYKIDGQPSVEEVAKSTNVSEITCENTNAGIKFTLPEGQNGVYALVWQEAKHSITINYINEDTKEALSESKVLKFTNGSSYDVSEFTQLPIQGYTLLRVEGNASGEISGDTIVNVYYKNYAPTLQVSDKSIIVGDEFDPMDGVLAQDQEDGDVTAKIEIKENTVDTSKPGTYKVTYEVTDSQGAKATKTISVTVNPKMEVINAIPTIKAEDKTITVGDKFDPLKDVTAKDKEDGDITKNIKVILNAVNTTKPGRYLVTYEVTDSAGLSASKTITVTVKDKAIVDEKPNEDKPNKETDKGTNTGLSTGVGLFASLGTTALSSIGILEVLRRKNRK